MKSISFLAQTPLEKPLTIHRILGIERFLQMIHENSLTLMAPERWEDPYEKALQKHYEGNGSSFRGFRIYGLCWSTEARSDALWRIYSPTKLGIKISTTVERLVSAISHHDLTQRLTSRMFLGQVAYLPERTSIRREYQWPNKPLGLRAAHFFEPVSTFANAIDQISMFQPTQDEADLPMIARAFLVKRRAFKHEDEVRLLCIPRQEDLAGFQTEQQARAKLIKLTAPAVQLISRVEFDPRMDDDVAAALTRFISPLLPDLNVGKTLVKSSLYRIPKSKNLPE